MKMLRCIKCGISEDRLVMYKCDKCGRPVCEDCQILSHSYDRLMGELLCPYCLDDLIKNRNDHRDFAYSNMINYVHLE